MSAYDLAGATSRGVQEAPLFAGIAADEVERLEHFMACFELAEGERLFRQGDRSDCMYLIEQGSIELQVDTAGGGTRVLAEVGPGDVLGEVSLLCGGIRTASAVARERTTGWILYRAAFETLRLDSGAGSIELMARLAELAVARLRERYETIAADLAGERASEFPPASSAPPVPASPALCTPAYLQGLLCFRGFHGPDQVAAALGGGEPYELPRGSRVLAAEGRPEDLLLVVRGAVDVSVRRGGLAQHVRLAGPGRFVGHLGVLDENQSPVAAHSRERVVLIALPGEHVRSMMRGAGAVARRLAAAVTEDVARALKQAERPMARTAWGSPGA